MATVVEIDPTRAALTAAIANSLNGWPVEVLAKDVTVVPYCFDARVQWDTHIVSLNGYGVFGFTDGPLQGE
jgi:hypothetical protein